MQANRMKHENEFTVTSLVRRSREFVIRPPTKITRYKDAFHEGKYSQFIHRVCRRYETFKAISTRKSNFRGEDIRGDVSLNFKLIVHSIGIRSQYTRSRYRIEEDNDRQM